MIRFQRATLLAPIAAVLSLSACEQQSALPTQPEIESVSAAPANAVSDASMAKIERLVDRANTKLAAAGSPVRVGMPWLFTVGQGVDPFANLRTGMRWHKANVSYILDKEDYTSDVSQAQVDEAMQSAYDSWNEVGNTYIQANRIADPGGNIDIADGIVRDRKTRECVDFLDYSSDVWVKDKRGNLTGEIQPRADIVVAGWTSPEYFEDCLGSANIIAVTWSFYLPDANGDNYLDFWFVEQIYNTNFKWTTSASAYLDFDAPFDVESIAVHENGHALGLDHFGGPVVDSQYKLKGQDRVFDPEAVMNPYYIGGEKRTPFPTDVSGLNTLYTGHTSTTL